MEALPTSPLGQRLCKTFPYRWKWIEALNDNSSESTNWATQTKHPIKPRSLWAKYQDAETLIGVRFGSTTEYALIDVDSESFYLGQVDTILAALETIGICRVIILRSSWSGGVHIYVPLPRPYPTFSVALAVANALEAQGMQLQPGQIEVFPNRKVYAKNWLGEFTDYQPHRLPLQPCSGGLILTSDLQPVEGAHDLSRFFAIWDNCLLFQDDQALDQAIAVARSNRRRRRRSVGPVEGWKQDLVQTISEGWTGHGQTNDLLKQIGCYGRVFEGLGGVALAEYIERVATSSPGFERWCRHQGEIWKRSCVWGKAVEHYYWPLGAEPLRQRRTIATVRQTVAEDAQRRITAAMGQLEGYQGTIKNLARTVCKLAKCSQQTLYKYLHLWHPQPPAAPAQAVEGVTDHAARGVGPMGSILQQINESLRTADLQWVTPNGGENETCGLENCLPKFFNSGLDGGGPGGEGFSTGLEHA